MHLQHSIAETVSTDPRGRGRENARALGVQKRVKEEGKEGSMAQQGSWKKEKKNQAIFNFSSLSVKKINIWWWRDSNPQPPGLMHDELDHRTTVSCLAGSDHCF